MAAREWQDEIDVAVKLRYDEDACPLSPLPTGLVYGSTILFPNCGAKWEPLSASGDTDLTGFILPAGTFYGGIVGSSDRLRLSSKSRKRATLAT